MVEHLTFNQVVVGSIPTRLTIMRPLRLARPRTPPFHGGDRGSNPLGDANNQSGTVRYDTEALEKSRAFLFLLSQMVQLDMMESKGFDVIFDGMVNTIKSKYHQNGYHHTGDGPCQNA